MKLAKFMTVAALMLIISAIGGFNLLLMADDTSLDTYELVYLVDSSADIDELLQVQNLEDLLGYEINLISNWNDLLLYQSILGIDALFIHTSAVDWIDEQWLATEYNQGLVVTGFDINPQIFSDLLNQPDLSDRYELIDGYLVFVSVFNLDSTILLQDTAYQFVGQQNISGSTVGSLNIENEIAGFQDVIHKIETIKQTKQEIVDFILN